MLPRFVCRAMFDRKWLGQFSFCTRLSTVMSSCQIPGKICRWFWVAGSSVKKESSRGVWTDSF